MSTAHRCILQTPLAQRQGSRCRTSDACGQVGPEAREPWPRSRAAGANLLGAGAVIFVSSVLKLVHQPLLPFSHFVSSSDGRIAEADAEAMARVFEKHGTVQQEAGERFAQH